MAERTRRNRTATAIRFPDDLHAQLVQAAQERDVSVNLLVVKAVADFLPRLIPAAEFSWVRNEGDGRG